MTTKTLPDSKEAEMMVLGCALTSPEAFKLATELLHDADFHYAQNKLIFQVMKESQRDEKRIDAHVISEDLKRRDQLKDAGGTSYIVTLAQFVGTSANVKEYISEVQNYAAQRETVRLFEEQTRGLINGEDHQSIIMGTQEALKRIERRTYAKDKFPIRFMDEINKEYLLRQPDAKPMLLTYDQGGYLPKGIVAMLAGAGGVGKSHLLAQLAIAVASGAPWLGKFNSTLHCGPECKGNVFLGFGENTDEDIHRLLYKASKDIRERQPDITEEDPLKAVMRRIAPFSFCGQQASFIERGEPSRYYRALKTKLIERAPKDGWALVIFDPVSRLLGADAETDNAAATQFIALLEELTLDLPGKPTVLFAHHVNKSAIAKGDKQDQSAARGSSALTDGVRWQCNLAKKNDHETTKDLIALTMTKSNLVKIPAPIILEKDSEGFLKPVNEVCKAKTTQKYHQYE